MLTVTLSARVKAVVYVPYALNFIIRKQLDYVIKRHVKMWNTFFGTFFCFYHGVIIEFRIPRVLK